MTMYIIGDRLYISETENRLLTPSNSLIDYRTVLKREFLNSRFNNL